MTIVQNKINGEKEEERESKNCNNEKFTKFVKMLIL